MTSVAYRKCGWGGQTECFQNVGGTKVYTMHLTFKSLGGARAHQGEKAPLPSLNASLYSASIMYGLL